MKKIFTYLLLTLSFFPFITFAYTNNIRGVIIEIVALLNLIVPIMFALALIGFLYGMVRYIFQKDKDMKETRDLILYGAIGLAAMMSIWGLANLLVNSFFNPQELQPSYINNIQIQPYGPGGYNGSNNFSG